jgi:tetratricopeptide (TPR) repeat protein
MPAATTQGHRRLSVAMIVRDAADSIAQSLECVREVADEIVVVDTGSTDRTRELALPRATRLLNFAWCDDYSAARNFCLDHVTGDWVFWLDAGEQLTVDAAQTLRALVDSQNDARTAFLVMVQVPPGPSQVCGEQAARLRLMPNDPQIRFSGRVRESTNVALESLDTSVQLAPFSIQRTTSEHDPFAKQTRALLNAHLAALEIAEKGPLPSSLLAIADACVKLGQLQPGLEFFAEALKLAPRDSTVALEAFYGILAALDQVPAAIEKQIALCNEALQVFPFDAQLLCAMGSYLQQQNRLDLACRSFEAAVRFGQVNPETWHLIDLTEVATSCHAKCQELLGHLDAAIATLRAGEARLAGGPRLRRHLLDLYIRHDRRKEALDEVNRLPAETTHREALRTAVRGACLAAKADWVPALAYLQTAFGSGCRDLLCLRWLTIASLTTDDLDGAQRALDSWRALGGDQREPEQFLLKLHHLRLTTNLLPTQENNLRLDAQTGAAPNNGPHFGQQSPRQNADAATSSLLRDRS